ncbi:type II toxin-antitoxin system VapC family toxin [Methylocystis bryophila]|uniref:DNA-binding protein n=1 Tax=Methylocystis bryophila TaxID=655015 RepID=A0A1W6MX17_9HYPH|nr:type II toxin-antitoxin system VapC family toxin [Methylocystis bryophila]ARN82118.1 DNA-binding protein [Methylocystis bryophila]BDV38248.1 DNA-binding protein [Methylocystis bryophila]
MIFVDTNILIDIATGDLAWFEWSIGALEAARREGAPLIINAVIYAEFSLGFASESDCDAEIARLGLVILDVPKAAAFRAGVAFRAYRRSGGLKTSPLPDFFIGAHASVLGAPILTRDVARYRTYFPEVKIVGPS